MASNSKTRDKNGADEIPVGSEADSSSQEVGVSSCTQTDVAMETDSNVSSEMAHMCDLDISSASCHSDTSTVNTSTGSSTNVTYKYKCPPRPGIQWKKGEKIEAMDSFGKWYAAKFAEIDLEEKLVLIHFEGWNQRYDEWVQFDSERLRAMTRHSERKDGRRRQKREHRPGERVLAKWTDCKMYPAKVTDVKSDGSLEVVFYDGFKRIVQPINVRPIPHEYKQIVNSEFRKMENKAAAASRSKSLDEGEKKHHKSETRSRSNSRDGKEEAVPRSTPKMKELKEMKRRRPTLNVLSRRKLAMTKTLASQRSGRGRKRVFHEMKKAENRRKAQHKVFPKKQQRIAKKSPATSTEDVKHVPPLSIKHAHTNKGDLRTKKRAISLPTTSTDQLKTPHSLPLMVPSSAGTTRHQSEVLVPSVVASKAFKIEEDHNMFKCTHEGCSKSFRKENLLESHIKYYHLDDKTAHTPAPRAKRRKTTSICSTDSDLSMTSAGKTSTPNDPSPAVSPIKRRRNISAEVFPFSSESPVNFGSPKETQTPHEITPATLKIKEELPETFIAASAAGCVSQDKKARHSNELSHAVVKEQKASAVVKEEHLKHTRSSVDSNVTEGSVAETEDEEDGNEIVNCLCGFFETDGLMIQCDICLCWQHALCLNLDKDSVPNNYVCFICENPPGVREGSGNVHNQEWLKTGHLPSFSFLNMPQLEESSEMMQATHSLVGDLQNIKAVLHGLQRQMKTCDYRDGESREISLWYKDWDNPNTDISADTTEEFHSISVEESPVSTTPIDTHEPSSNMETPVRFSLDIEQSSDLSGEQYKFQLPLATECVAQSLDNIDTTSEASTMTASESSTSFMSSYPSFSNIQAEGAMDSRADLLASTDSGGQNEDDKLNSQNVRTPRKSLDKETLLKNCHRNLLLHVLRTQTEVNQRLDLIEEQVSVLEKGDNVESTSESQETLHDIPVLKQTLHSLIRDLYKVKRMVAYH